MREYKHITDVYGPLLIIDGVTNAKVAEEAEIWLSPTDKRLGRVLEVQGDKVMIQLFEHNRGIDPTTTRVRLQGHPIELPVAREMIGRTFNGLGRVRDGGVPLLRAERRDVNGSLINPLRRQYPDRFLQTGISAIDGLNTLVVGQKLPIFSGAGLSHNQLAAQIVRQAKTLDRETEFAVVFCAMGITAQEHQWFEREFRRTGAFERTVMFVNLADDPVIERILVPRMALTAAEYLAFDLGMDVLVIMTDMTNYCNALREVSASRREVPARQGYPGYMYTDLASIYERSGVLADRPGSLTLLPILTMPDDDKSHPVPDLTGYITEGQIILSREQEKQGIEPPVDVLPSLSRLKDKGIGEGKTRADHRAWMNQMFASYARGRQSAELGSILGAQALSETDRLYERFSQEFDRQFLNQGYYTDRSIETTLQIGWSLLKKLPAHELKDLPEEIRKQFLAQEDD